MSDYTPMYPDELERAKKAPRLKSYDDLEDENVALKQQLAELREAADNYIKAEDAGMYILVTRRALKALLEGESDE